MKWWGSSNTKVLHEAWYLFRLIIWPWHRRGCNCFICGPSRLLEVLAGEVLLSFIWMPRFASHAKIASCVERLSRHHILASVCSLVLPEAEHWTQFVWSMSFLPSPCRGCGLRTAISGVLVVVPAATPRTLVVCRPGSPHVKILNYLTDVTNLPCSSV